MTQKVSSIFEWENVAYLAEEELEKFEKTWREYRESIDNG